MAKEEQTTTVENQEKIEGTTPTTKNELTQKGGVQTNTRVHVMITLISVVTYIIIFIVMFYNIGSAMSMSALIPVVVVGWLFGLKPAICAGLLSLPVNLLMRSLLGADMFDETFSQGAGLAGTGAIILNGVIVGRLRDLRMRFRKELFERKQAEAKTKQHSDELDAANESLQEEINERERAAEELRETKEELENLIEISSDPIIVGDSKGHIVKPNKAFLKMIGYSEEEVIGEPPHAFSISHEGTYESTTGELVTINEDFFEETLEKIARFIEKRRLSDWLSYYINKENKIVPTTQNFVSLHNDKGERTGTFAIIRDITEQKKAELELVKSRETAMEANQSKSVFLANMSHEIRTPMNGVIGFTDMLLDTDLDSDQMDYARTIKQSGEALLSIINDILDFSKIEAGKIDIEEIDFDIEVLAYDVCELMRPRLEKGEVEILCRIGDNLPAQVKGDPHRFRQVLVNLMGNAVKFTETGEIELSLDVKEEQDGWVMIYTKVRDTGIGIPGDKLEPIFDVFQQADGSTIRKYGGTGLGLSICRRIANLMGGNAWAESEVGKGSTFHFTALLKQAEGRQVKRFAPVSLSGKKVLITDDNETNLDILSHIIESAGMRSFGFTRGKEALKAMQDAFEANDPFDICILDIMMPDVSGYELAKGIRLSAGESMPLLAFTSSTRGGAKECRESGFNGFLPKPISRIKLLKMMERLLGEATDREQQEEREAKIVTQHSMREDAKHATSILLAEDNPVNQKLATKLLVKAGYRVDVASNGNEAVAMFTAEPEKYDIIFMDVQMPGLNGLDATKQIREWELRNSGIEELNNSKMKAIDANKPEIQNPKSKIRQIPIVAMTAGVMKGDREKCLASGMNDYVPKPIKREVVFDMLRKWVFERV